MPTLRYNGRLKHFARKLRSNMTDAELLLWSRIRRKQLKYRQFYRQRIIGRYIVDFYCPKDKLVVELDGGQHYTDVGKLKDGIRDDFMRSKGLTVLRFSDREVLKSLGAVLEVIYRHLKSPFKKGDFWGLAPNLSPVGTIFQGTCLLGPGGLSKNSPWERDYSCFPPLGNGPPLGGRGDFVEHRAVYSSAIADKNKTDQLAFLHQRDHSR